ncbi:acylphosphatase [Methanothrix thermoacetophila]|uniref:acylphosphatase n=1 Tax=Methanothrix thermoacetophila (strain DSM 6194 / JCM 14653 / NBRC 101360 / PT) TaxID=349307 RepID=A0B7R2_METTP|nr:acylphosphatase [Methanothrix thermoacetophila]ABK14736.1 acylphosphatase [Methanothrix thermoacetophila PT]
MRRVEIIAKGDVQRVGYRDAVQNIARRLGVSGIVQNVEPYDVRIVAEGEEDALKEFLRAINIQERPIRVEELEVRWADATGEFQYFRILRGDWQEELGERFDVAIRYLQRSIELGEQNLAVGRENLSIGRMMLEKQDQMLEKQDQMLEKQDAMLEKQDETIEELRGVRSDLREHMDKRFARIENEIAEIKRAIRELGGSCI